MHERRKLPRLTINKRAQMKLDLDEPYCACQIQDIHLKGMCLKIPQWLSRNHSLKMILKISEEVELEIEVDVPWVKLDGDGYAYGIMFRLIADEDKDRIYEYIRRNCAKQIRQRWWA